MSECIKLGRAQLRALEHFAAVEPPGNWTWGLGWSANLLERLVGLGLLESDRVRKVIVVYRITLAGRQALDERRGDGDTDE